MDVLDHPKIAVPGKGTYTVKFGLGAQYTLEKEHHVTMEEVGRRLQECSPRVGTADCFECAGTGHELNTVEQSGEPIKCKACNGSGKETTPGRISPPFLFDVLSACIWDQVELKPRALADCFETFDQLGDVAKVVMIAFTKTRWSANKAGPASATDTGQQVKAIQ